MSICRKFNRVVERSDMNVIKYKCLSRIKDNKNNIVGYKFIDQANKEVVIESQLVKELIKSGEIQVINLKLTSDNRLIRVDLNDKNSICNEKLDAEHRISKFIHRAMTLGENERIKVGRNRVGDEFYLISFNSNNHVLYIPKYIETLIYKNLRGPGYINSMDDICNRLTGKIVVIGGSGLRETSRMFYKYDNIEEIDLKYFDTSNVKDMWWMFSGCNNLKNIEFGKFNTSNVTHMYGMFSGCSSLINLDLSSFDTSNVTIMRDMFYGCSRLVGLNLSSFKTGSLTSMNSMFSGCYSLESLDLSNFDTSNVAGMSNLFEFCTRLKHLNIGGFNTDKVSTMEGMFKGCKSLEKLDLSHFDTSSVSSMEDMFYGCINLKELNISRFSEESLLEVYHMFDRHNSELKVIYNKDTFKKVMSSEYKKYTGLENG